ncbi:MAG: 3D domain-containing protein [Kiritimatiellaceae bacterium]|nr:3D domain-containing protein [Kiritimatiellaceae bacterium]
MKRRIIYWATGILILLMLVNCHWVFPPLRKPDAVITVKTTGYCACMKCSGWRFNWFGLPSRNGKVKIVGQNASGGMVRPGAVAVDPKVFPPGTKFYIPGYGWGIAEDVGGGINRRELDLYFRQHRCADNWGAQTKKVKVWYPRD